MNPCLPDKEIMLRAFLHRDPEFEDVFVAGIRTTGIFCRPTCPARKPMPENVEFFTTPAEALKSGYRPCFRCRPMEPSRRTPGWLRPLLHAVDNHPSRRWTEKDMENFGVNPTRVRRWFKSHHGITFLAYLRARRLGEAFSRVQSGQSIAESGLDAGYDSLSGFCNAIQKATGQSPGKLQKQNWLRLTEIQTPLGPLLAAADESRIYLCEFWDRRNLESQFISLKKDLGLAVFPGSTPLLEQLATEIHEYFEGRRTLFDVSLDIPGSSLQKVVWEALRAIPYGHTRTYGELAENIGRPRAVRNVARIIGQNRLAILLPCHRVINRQGGLSGYGGGLWRKQFLLNLEQENLAKP